MKIIVRDKLLGERYELEIFEETTAEDVIDALIESGLIRPGYEWVLIDSRLVFIRPNEKISSRLSPESGENEVFLVAWSGGNYYVPSYMSYPKYPIIVSPLPKPKNPVIVNDRLSCRRYLLEVFWENTAEDIICALINAGLVKHKLCDSCELVLVDRCFTMSHDERVIPRISSNRKNEVYLDVKPIPPPIPPRPPPPKKFKRPIIIDPPLKPKHTIIVNNMLNGEKYELGVFHVNTARDVINALINAGLIEDTPRKGYIWTLIDSRTMEIPPDERILFRLSSIGGNEVYLDEFISKFLTFIEGSIYKLRKPCRRSFSEKA